MGNENHDAREILSQIADIAEAMRDGRMSFIEGARRITELSARTDLWEDPDFVTLRMIDSETDALPLGEVRKLWRKDALERLQPDIERSEAWARDVGLQACESLIERFKERAGRPRPQG